MALPAVLLKAKGALKKGSRVYNAAKQAKELDVKGIASSILINKFRLPIIAGMIGFVFILLITILIFAYPRIIVEGLRPQTANASESCNGSIDSYIQWAMDTADDDSHGYSQDTRYGNPNYDCSSFVWYALVEGAKFSKDDLGGSAFTTGTMTELLKKVGFEKHEYKGHDDLQPGDILWVHNNEHQHTEIYIGEGKTVGAHSSKYAQADQISAGKDKNTGNWTHYFRLGSDNSCESTGNGKILLLAGHTFCTDCADARESKTKSGYTEPTETRKLVKKIKSQLDSMGVSADIGNALLAGDNDKMDASFFMANAHGENKSNFKKYDWGKYKYVLEVHFNAGNGKASGTCLMQLKKDPSYVSKADKDIVKAITSKTGKQDYGWCSSAISNTSDQSYFHRKKIPMTYVEVEFYDNKKAMDKYTKNIDEIAKGIAEAIKKHYG